jgi:hypothetical protein
MMNRTHHSAHARPAPHRKPNSWAGVKRAYRLAFLHALLAVTDGHAWNALALTAMAALTAIPAEILSAHSWLRTGTPIVLAAIGILARAKGRHAVIKQVTS